MVNGITSTQTTPQVSSTSSPPTYDAAEHDRLLRRKYGIVEAMQFDEEIEEVGEE